MPDASARQAPNAAADGSLESLTAGQRYEDFKSDEGSKSAYSRMSSAEYLSSDRVTQHRKKRKRKRVLVGVFTTLLVLLLAGAGTAFAYLATLNSNLASGVTDELLDALMPPDAPGEPFYMLLLGTDGSMERDTDSSLAGTYRSDSLMLARIDPKSKKVTLVSIPRDLKVDLGEYGVQKINAALAFGGPSLAVKTVSTLAGVPISHYAEVNFDGFRQVVDALGGIEVDVPIAIDDDEAGGALNAGLQTLNGEQALILCRTRHTFDDIGGGDIYRVASQRLVLSAIADKLLNSNPFALANTASSLSEYVVTDMGVTDIAAYAQSMRGLDSETDVYTATAPTTSEELKGVWYEVLDVDAWKSMMRRMDAGLPPLEETEVDEYTGIVMASVGEADVDSGSSMKKKAIVNPKYSVRIRNGNGRDGVSSEATSKVKDMGYKKVDSGNADSFDYPETLVIYKDDSLASDAQAIVDELGCGRAMKDDGSYLFESTFLVVIGADWPN